MAVTKSDVFANDTTGMENKTVIVTTILVNTLTYGTYSMETTLNVSPVMCKQVLYQYRLSQVSMPITYQKYILTCKYLRIFCLLNFI